MQRDGAAGRRPAGPEHEVGLARGHRGDDRRQRRRVERRVRVAERNDRSVRHGQTRRARRAEPPARFLDHDRTGGPGDAGRAVGRAVVDDDRPVARRHAGQHPRQGADLVEHGEHDVDRRVVSERGHAGDRRQANPYGVGNSARRARRGRGGARTVASRGPEHPPAAARASGESSRARQAADPRRGSGRPRRPPRRRGVGGRRRRRPGVGDVRRGGCRRGAPGRPAHGSLARARRPGRRGRRPPRCRARRRRALRRPRAPWRAVPWGAGLAAAGWATALAAADGWHRVTEPLTTRHEYEPFAAGITDVGGFVDGIRRRSPHLSRARAGTPARTGGARLGPRPRGAGWRRLAGGTGLGGLGRRRGGRPGGGAGRGRRARRPAGRAGPRPAAGRRVGGDLARRPVRGRHGGSRRPGHPRRHPSFDPPRGRRGAGGRNGAPVHLRRGGGAGRPRPGRHGTARRGPTRRGRRRVVRRRRGRSPRPHRRG